MEGLENVWQLCDQVSGKFGITGLVKHKTGLTAGLFDPGNHHA